MTANFSQLFYFHPVSQQGVSVPGGGPCGVNVRSEKSKTVTVTHIYIRIHVHTYIQVLALDLKRHRYSFPRSLLYLGVFSAIQVEI